MRRRSVHRSGPTSHRPFKTDDDLPKNVTSTNKHIIAPIINSNKSATMRIKRFYLLNLIVVIEGHAQANPYHSVHAHLWSANARIAPRTWDFIEPTCGSERDFEGSLVEHRARLCIDHVGISQPHCGGSRFVPYDVAWIPRKGRVRGTFGVSAAVTDDASSETATNRQKMACKVGGGRRSVREKRRECDLAERAIATGS